LTAVSPLTKAARQAQIAAILAQARVRSQEELAGLLAQRGVRVAQATLSRDLEEIGAVRLREPNGALVYALPGEPGGPGSRPGGVGGPLPAAAEPGGPGAEAADPGEPARRGRGPAQPARPAGEHGPFGPLSRVAGELLVSAEASANLVVLRTPAGGAQLLASAIDHAGWPSILGTVAGDDTVLVITRDPAGGADVAAALLRLAERRA
jgi:transcriptional regulator of arginine metabolism